MLSMGLSKPWQDALMEIADQREMDANAIRDYFAPLQKWLDEQNKGKPVGWLVNDRFGRLMGLNVGRVPIRFTTIVPGVPTAAGKA